MKKLLVFVSIILLCSFRVFAEETTLELSEEVAEEAVAGLKPTSWLGKFQNLRQAWEEKYGTTFAVVINSQSQVALRSKENQGQWSAAWYYNVAVEQKLWKNSSVVFEIEGGHNKGIDRYFSTFSIFDSDAGEITYLYVTEFYLKQNFFDEKLYFVTGRMDLSDWCDTNEVANSSDTQFLSSSLVDNMTIPFPQKGLGLMAGVKPFDWFYLQAGASDAKAVSTMVGLTDPFKGAFFIAEAGFSPKIGELQGNYRFIFHANHQRLYFIDGSGSENQDYGFALSFDQKISDQVTLFLRYGFADEEVRIIKNFWSTGMELVGPIPGRENDVLGLGIAQSIAGEDYRKENGSVQAETMYEVYYNLSLHPFVKLIPNLEIVTNPLAEKHSGVDIVTGARLVVIF